MKTESNLLELRKFVMPEVVYGHESVNLAGRYAKNFGANKVFIVTDPGVIQVGWVNRIINSLEKENIEYYIFSDVSPNPRDIEVMTGVDLYKNNFCDIILAVGGGSTMDCAKGIAIVSTNQKHILEFEGIDKVLYPMPPLICVPTTGGTAADVSQFAIITDLNEKVKKAIISKAIVPDVTLIDPETLTTMDPYLTACTGMDVLVHAIEAFVSNANSHITDLYALDAIKLISQNLILSLEKPTDLEIRGKVMLASLHAGLAFSNASLGAVHAMAHSLGGYKDLPHGECNSILLRHVILYNYDIAEDRFNEIGKAMGLDLRKMTQKEKRLALFNRVTEIGNEAGITYTLSDRGIKSSDIPNLAKFAIKDPCILTNPKKPSQRDIEVIYEEAS